MELPSFDKIWLFTSKQTFHFKVQACMEANIFLAQKPYHKGVGAQIKIGTSNNQQTTIIPDVSNSWQSKSADTPRVLDCDIMREFWISWDQNTIRVGYGRVNEDVIVSTPYSVEDIKAFSISTVDNVEGFWEINRREGEFSVSVHLASSIS